MRMQVKLEIGHKAACRSEPTPEGFTHDWTVFVRGSEGKEISHFVEKVVFHLHESFPKPKRAIKEPPYKLDESGYGSFELKIEVCFKTKDEPRRVHFTYDLFLPLSGLPPVTSVRTEALTFTHPTEDFMKKLVKGGGIPISNVNGVSNGLSNGHPPPREESKESAPKLLSNEHEKNKKIKISKTSSKPSSAVVGMKRSPPLHEQTQQTITDGVPKKKKKSSEGSSSTKIKHLQSENTVVPASQPLTTEVKELKVKFKPVPPKESVEKEKKKDSSKSHKTEHENKKVGGSEHKIKVKKKGEKSEKKKEKKEKNKSKKDKIEKVTIRRSSGDSWASSGGLMSNVFAKNKALGKMLSEMSSDEDEDVVIPTPFKREPSPVLSKVAVKEKADLPPPFKHGSKTSHREKSDLTAGSKCELSEDLIKNSQKEQILNKNIVNTSKSKDNNASHEDSETASHFNTKEQHSQENDTMETSSIMENGISNDEKIINDKLSNKELYDLYEQITKCKDGEFLQKVVDVIERTGLYTVADKTFEFDLCCLGKTTLKQLQKCLGIT